MPCFNGEQYISLSINSLLSQSFTDFELIIIDDGSTDNSFKEIQYFTDSRIKYYHLGENKGTSFARNKGIELSVGKYISMLDVDDIAKPDCLLTQFRYLEENPQIGGIGGLSEIIDENGKVTGLLQQPLKHIHLKLLLIKDNTVTLSTIMIRSRLLKRHNLLFNENYKYAGDYEFIVRAMKLFRIVNLNTRLIQYRKYSSEITSVKRQEQIEFTNRIRKQQLEIFTVDYTQKEYTLHIKLMTNSLMSKSDIEDSVVWLNKLLEINYIKKIYPQKHLLDIFDLLLTTAQQKRMLGGWAIEREMIDFIKSKVLGQKTILEFGSGIGTEYLLEHYKVCSIEHDMNFVQVRGQFHTCNHVPIKNGWYDKTILKGILTDQHFDLILVDGPPGDLREGILNNLHLLQTINCPVIFDDVDRELDFKTMNTFCDRLNFSFQIIKGNKKQFAYCIKKRHKK